MNTRFEDLMWYPCLLDLTISGFFLWGRVTVYVYTEKLHTMGEFKAGIIKCTDYIYEPVLRRVEGTFKKDWKFVFLVKVVVCVI